MAISSILKAVESLKRAKTGPNTENVIVRLKLG
jgi:hypothetical protein